MNFSTQIDSKTSGNPLLFLHGLGSKTPRDPILEKTLNDLGYTVSSLLRDDRAILDQEKPYEIYRQETTDMIHRLSDISGKKVTLVGNSLGSYIALLTAFQISDRVHAVLGLDAFLTPSYGFTQMQQMSLKLEKQLEGVDESDMKSFGKSYQQELLKKQEGSFIVPLVDGFIELPQNLSHMFPDIAEISGSQEIPFPVALVYAAGDSFLSPSKPPYALISGKNITHFEISHVLDDNGNEKKAEHNDWKKSPDAIRFAKDFLKKNI